MEDLGPSDPDRRSIFWLADGRLAFVGLDGAEHGVMFVRRCGL